MSPGVPEYHEIQSRYWRLESSITEEELWRND